MSKFAKGDNGGYIVLYNKGLYELVEYDTKGKYPLGEYSLRALVTGRVLVRTRADIFQVLTTIEYMRYKRTGSI